MPNLGGGVFGDAIVITPGNAGFNGVGPTVALAVGDVDGDSHVDLVFGEEGAPNILVRNNGAGGFEAATELPGQARPQ